MLQAHSLLWHYLWVAPSVLLLVLAGRMAQLRLHRKYPLFFAFVLASAIEQLTLYACDVVPSIEPLTWWRIFWVGLVVEGVLKFALVGEIFAHIFGAYATIANLGKFMIRSVGGLLVLAAAVAAAWAPADSAFSIVNGAHRIQQGIYLIEAGLLVSIYLLSSYFHLAFRRAPFGIALGLTISACVHLATWGVAANAGLPTEKRLVLDFVNMATFHLCVLIWCYYLLVPVRVRGTFKVSSFPLEMDVDPGLDRAHDLEALNEELERLLRR